MADNEDEMTNCSICFEEYQDTGPYVPRMLPCLHSICEKCVLYLLGGNKRIVCPECRVEHAAPNDAKTFQQNKYILGHIKKLKTKPPPKEDLVQEMCSKHGTAVIFYCKNEDCKCFICHVCLIESHKQHDIVDVGEGKKMLEKQKKNDAVTKEMGKELNRLGRIKNRIKSTEKSIKAQNEETKVRITTCKKEVNNTFDALMKNIEKKTKDFEKQLNHNKDDVGSKINLIESIKKVEAQSNVSALSETFDNIKKHLDESIVSEGDLDALVQKHAVLSAEVCRAFCEKLVTALKILSEEKHSASGKAKPGPGPKLQAASARQSEEAAPAPPPSVVKFRLDPGQNEFFTTSDVLAIICGRWTWDAVVAYNLHNRARDACVPLNFKPQGMALVRLGDKLCVALSNRVRGGIEFNDLEHLRFVDFLGLGSAQVSTLCTASRQRLLCFLEPPEQGPGSVVCIDCISVPPQASGSISTVRQVSAMCYVESGCQELLVTAQGESGLRAYNVKTKKLVWKFSGKPGEGSANMDARSLSADGKGNLFVYDVKNACVQMFSFSGKYQRSIETRGETECMLSWHEASSSLVVAQKP